MDTSQGASDVALLGRLVMGAGVASTMAGTAAWLTVRSQLAAERIVIPDSAPWFPGRVVKGPVSALVQAEVIRRTALKATNGRTYGELAADDPVTEMAMNASLLRGSLFTSVLAFGVAGAQVGIGAVMVATGAALRSASRRLPAG